MMSDVKKTKWTKPEAWVGSSRRPYRKKTCYAVGGVRQVMCGKGSQVNVLRERIDLKWRRNGDLKGKGREEQAFNCDVLHYWKAI